MGVFAGTDQEAINNVKAARGNDNEIHKVEIFVCVCVCVCVLWGPCDDVNGCLCCSADDLVP